MHQECQVKHGSKKLECITHMMCVTLCTESAGGCPECHRAIRILRPRPIFPAVAIFRFEERKGCGLGGAS